MRINDLSSEKVISTFCEKELEKTNQQQFSIQKYARKKAINYLSNGKVIIVYSIGGGLIKKA